MARIPSLEPDQSIPPKLSEELPKMTAKLDELSKQLEESTKDINRPQPVPVDGTIDHYGVKYQSLRQQMIANADAIALNYENLAKRYMDMAAKVREQGTAAADQHIDDLIALDQAQDAIGRHFKEPRLPPPRANGK